MSAKASGKIGERLVFSKRSSGQQARFQKAQKDKITEPRTIQRTFYSDTVLIWNKLSASEKLVYENLAKGKNYTAFNAFMKRRKRLWCQFGADYVNKGFIKNVGSVSSFNFIHQTGIFRIEWEWNIAPITVNEIPCANKGVAAVNGIYLFRNFVLPTRLLIYFGSGGVNILSDVYWTVFNTNGKYKLILVGDGTGVTLYAGIDGSIPVSYGKKNFTRSIVPTGNAYAYMDIGGVTTTAYLKSKMRNLKFYSSMDTSVLKNFYPMQITRNLGKDFKGTINGVPVNVALTEA